MRSHPLAYIIASLLVAAGCFTDEQNLGSVTTSTTTGSQGGAGGGQGGAGGGQGGAGGDVCNWTHTCPCGPVICGYTCDGCSRACDPATPCPDGFWCDYADDKCGTGEPTGVCTPRMAGGCGEDDRRTCSCGGVVPILCPGVVAPDLAEPELCSDGTFACGDLQCQSYLEYCETVLPGVPGSEPSYACKSSASCEIVYCSCIPDLPPGSCSIGADAQMRVTIALP